MKGTQPRAVSTPESQDRFRGAPGCAPRFWLCLRTSESTGKSACATNEEVELFEPGNTNCPHGPERLFEDKHMQTQDEVIAAVKAAAEELGRVPSLEWLVKYDKVSEYAVKKHFGHFRKCLETAGLQPHRHGYE